MLGILLHRHGWHKRPVTHAALLWALVAFAAMLLVAFFAYSKQLTSLRTGSIEARPAKTVLAASLPSVFGTVISFDGATIMVDSKQPFDRIFVDDVTDISRVGGGTFNQERLNSGMIVMATGHDDGAGALLADALVVFTEEDLDTNLN